MIGVPFSMNDGQCLGAITELAATVVADLVAHRDPVIVELAARYPDTADLAAWIRTLPQRDDQGDPDDGPKVDVCRPAQRLRFPASDPNCVERSMMYLAVAELLDPRPVRQLATLDFEWGRHTFPIESGAPVILDPRVSEDDLAPVAERASREPVQIEVSDAVTYTARLAATGAAETRNGPSYLRHGERALSEFVEYGRAPRDPRTIEAVAWLLAQAERVAHRYGPRALAVVRTTARAISELMEIFRRRNLGLEVGGTTYTAPSWLVDGAQLAGKIGLDLGAVALRPELASLGITGEMFGLVEQELNAAGLSLGALAHANPAAGKTSALGSIAQRR